MEDLAKINFTKVVSNNKSTVTREDILEKASHGSYFLYFWRYL